MTEDGLELLAGLVERTSGIRTTPAQRGALRRALERVAPGVGPAAFVEQASVAGSGAPLLARLIDELTIKETFFFRERAQLDAISWQGLLEGARAAGAKEIRVWSAGCATGEEAYSLALLAREAFAPAEPPVRILGTDVSERALAAAAAGRYRRRSVQRLDEPLRRRYLREENGAFVVGDELRSLVEFRRHNLVAEPTPPFGEAPFDLILCRNVAIYFDAAAVDALVERLAGALRPGGRLVLGAADALCSAAAQLARLAASPVPARTASRRERLRRPLGRVPAEPRETVLAAALAAAGTGRREEALARAASLVAHDVFDAEAHFVRGLVELDAGEPRRAVESFRRALYADPTFALAAFQLGRAYDALGDACAARRAYEQSLHALDRDGGRHELLAQQVDGGDVAAACRARIRSLGATEVA